MSMQHQEESFFAGFQGPQFITPEEHELQKQELARQEASRAALEAARKADAAFLVECLQEQIEKAQAYDM